MPPQLQANYSLKKQGRVFHGRTKTACSFCRKKKVKCDGKVPCSTCLQHKNQQCDLISQVAPNRSVQNSQIIKPKLPIKNANNVLHTPAVSSNEMGLYANLIGNHSGAESLNKASGQFAECPCASSEETINFFQDGGKIVAISPYSRQFFGPFSWLSLLLNDIYALPYMRYILSHKKDFNTIIEDLETYTKDNHTFKDENLNNNINLSNLQKGTNINEIDNKSAYIHHAVQKNDLMQSIKLILPKKDVIWKLINQFFLAAYPFFPLVEESDFRRHLEEIIGEEDYTDTKVADFTIRKRVDYAVIGLLLLFLRIAYLSLSSNIEDNGPKDVQKSPIVSEREYLLSNPIKIEAFTVAKNCFSQFDYFNCIDIQVLQLVLFIRIYYIYAPEEGDDYDGKISRILNSTIIQMAYSMGLHRDPGHLPYNFNNIKLNNNLNRKIWYFIVSLDYNSSILSGDPLSTKIIPADTNIPDFNPDYENTNKNVENEIVEVLADTKVRLAMSKTVIDIVLNIEQGANVKQLLVSLANLESLSHRDVVLDQFYKWDKIPLKKMIEMKNNLELRFWLSSIYFKLFIHYEERKNNDLICVYSKKILKISVVEIIPYILKVSDSRTKTLSEFDIFYILPSLLLLSHKFIFSVSFVLIRVKYFEFKLKLASKYESNILENDSLYNKAQRLIYLLQACIKWILDFLKRLSKSYFKAWRLYKVQNHILSIIASENFYLESKTAILNLWNPFSEQTIEELIETLQPAVNDIEASNKMPLFLQNFSICEESKNQMDFMRNDAMEFDSFWLDMISRNNPIDFEQDYIFNPFASLDMALDPALMSDFNNDTNSMQGQK